jgi:hypothetical protein
MSGLLSNLRPIDKQIARAITRRAALVGLKNATALHYTEGDTRWMGIEKHLLSEKGEFPTEADCSSFATWCLWNGLFVRFSQPDNVNGEDWKAGYTGSLVDHGMPVAKLSEVAWGDLVIYGDGVSDTKHTAVITNVGTKSAGGVPHVVSNGSEGGPYWLPYNYRSDIVCVRRYI